MISYVVISLCGYYLIIIYINIYRAYVSLSLLQMDRFKLSIVFKVLNSLSLAMRVSYAIVCKDLYLLIFVTKNSYYPQYLFVLCNQYGCVLFQQESDDCTKQLLRDGYRYVFEK